MVEPMEKAGASKAHLHLGAGLFFGAWSALGWYSQLSNAQISDDFGADPGPGLLPAIVLSILTLGALVLTGFGLRECTKSGLLSFDWAAALKDFLEPALLCLSLAVYLPLIHILGFVPATVLYSTILMVALCRRELRTAPRATLLSLVIGVAACSALTYLLFIYWIGVPLR